MNMKDRIIAVYVLQRFVRMSRVLLPLYLDLITKQSLSISEKKKLLGIREVYDNFHADPSASRFLINSDILGMIQRIYQKALFNDGHSAESLFEYDNFIKESDRLIITWDKQRLN